MKFGIIMFPGSNCDHDAFYAASVNAGAEAVYVWHKDRVLPNDIDCIILPGGFSYGDYLRCGAIAKFSPIMTEVIEFSKKGKYIIGICNGFQVLTEVGLLKGALLRNASLSFACKDVYLKTVNTNLVFTSKLRKSEVIRVPIAHGEGNFFAQPNVIDELESNEQVVFRYCASDGTIDESSNPNGSINNIAGISNKERNVLGMMPHPERYSDDILGCNEGIKIFMSIISFIQ